MINKHYILNEPIQGISKFYLEHYDEINDKFAYKPVSYKMSIAKKIKDSYSVDTSRVNINSYELVQYLT